MKILCLSDLHIWNKLDMNNKEKWIHNIINKTLPDIIVITGDIFKSRISYNPYKQLDRICKGILTICCTGNHEYYYKTIEKVYDELKNYYDPVKYNVHYLEIIGHYQIKDLNFLGNVLWYDGSMRSLENQDLYDWAGGIWSDKYIKDFDYIKECNICVKQIKYNIDKRKTNILCTHCVPHKKLNWHILNNPLSLLNVYGGVNNLFKEIPEIKISISGHTHARIIGEFEKVMCINPGNDYYEPFKYYLLKI